jgi:two-component system LytT family response regulator
MPEPITVLIADDESSARRRLMALLAGQPDMRIVAECRDGARTVSAIAELQPALVFLDVEMPVLTGLEVVGRIGPERMPATVFATAYDHFAVAAFDANALDYLVKPFERERFERTLARVRQRLHGGQRAALAAAMHALAPKPDCERILVRDGDAQHLLKTDDILYITADGNYVRLHTRETHYQMRETMGRVLERFDPARFRRIHRSHIVNLDHVRKILPWFGGDSLVMMSDGARLTLSRTFKDALAQFA